MLMKEMILLWVTFYSSQLWCFLCGNLSRVSMATTTTAAAVSCTTVLSDGGLGCCGYNGRVRRQRQRRKWESQLRRRRRRTGGLRRRHRRRRLVYSTSSSSLTRWARSPVGVDCMSNNPLPLSPVGCLPSQRVQVLVAPVRDIIRPFSTWSFFPCFALHHTKHYGFWCGF